MTISHAQLRPLNGFKVVDAVSGPLSAITRLLGELGAEVVRLAPLTPDEDLDADQSPHEMLSQTFAHLGKRTLRLDLADADAVRKALSDADLVVEDLSLKASLASVWSHQGLRRARPDLVVITASAFGVGNSLSDWRMTDPVLHALSGELSRSGIAGRAPLMPPGQIALQCAIAQGAYVAALALYKRQLSGQGDHLDFSALDGAAQALDPGFGVSGSASTGQAARALSRDRPLKGYFYPILPCADGFVRICILAPRQWQGMFKWMGEPAQLASDAFNSTAFRFESPDLIPAIARFFAGKNRADLERDGQAHGVPISAVLTLEECLAAEHLQVRDAFADQTLGAGLTAPFPNGVVTIDGVRMSPRPFTTSARPAISARAQQARPLEGLKVLDLGVIVVGAEQGRLLGDMGADVIKIESLAFPDGMRQSHLPFGVSVSFAAGHRNKRSLGLNLKDPDGVTLFKRLAAKADIVLSNFKPGVMAGLGLGHEELARINPAIISVESSAFGATGPWSKRMGYGPLVRASSGLTGQWRYDDDPESYSDSVTIYPDHVSARAGVTAVIAQLIRRLETNKGAGVSISQSEVMLSHLGAEIAGAHLARQGAPGFEDATGPQDAPWGVFQAKGDDEWCVVTVRHSGDWAGLVEVLGRPDLAQDAALSTRRGRLAHAVRIHQAVSDWMAGEAADAAMRRLQAAGVPAARMLRVADQPDFPYFQERRFFLTARHPYLADEMLQERAPAAYENMPDPPLAPAPLMGEHTIEVLKDWLKLSDDEIQGLIARGVVAQTDPAVYDLIEKTKQNGEEKS